MADVTPTIKVKPWGKDQGDFVEINADDFDETVHALYDEADEAPEPATAEEIVAALAGLDPANDDHWTKGGLPDVSTVADLLGKPVTRAAISDAAPDAVRPSET